MNFNSWYNSNLGKQIDIDGVFGDQCVDVAMSWAQFCFPSHQWPELLGYGNAKDLYAAANTNFFDKLTGVTPQQGDMVIFGATNTNPYGHIAVVISADGTHMNVIEQNGFNPSGVAYTAQRPYINIIGFLRPKGEQMIGDTPQERSRFTKTHEQIRGRADAPGVFEQVALGQSWLHVIEILEDDPEANIHFDDATLGKTAREANWQQQLTDNQALITKLQSAVTTAGGTIDPKLQAEIDNINTNTTNTQSVVQQIWDKVQQISDKITGIFK